MNTRLLNSIVIWSLFIITGIVYVAMGVAFNALFFILCILAATIASDLRGYHLRPLPAPNRSLSEDIYTN